MSQVVSKVSRAFNATEAKNRFGAILKMAAGSQPVFIEKHGVVFAVVLDIDSYKELVRKARSSEERHLDELRAEFDAMYAQMQTLRSRKAVDALFAASAEELNRVAAKRLKARG